LTQTPLQLEKSAQRARSVIVSFRPLALARAGYVQNADLILADKIDNQLSGTFSGKL
jgi:hypothetical protein